MGQTKGKEIERKIKLLNDEGVGVSEGRVVAFAAKKYVF